MKTKFSPHFVRKKNSLALALTLTLTHFLNHLTNKQLWSTNALNSLINGSVTDYKVNIEILT